MPTRGSNFSSLSAPPTLRVFPLYKYTRIFKVMIELKGESSFDPRRHWRLQCRTRGSAESVASTVLRLSLERVKQRRQAS